MLLAQSKVTAQGQISIPVEVRKTLGIGPGSVLEWEEESGRVVVRKAGRHTSADMHRALFGDAVARGPSVNVEAGIKKYIRQRHARG